MAARVRPGDAYELQLIASTLVYGPQRSVGAVDFSKIAVRLPLAGP